MRIEINNICKDFGNGRMVLNDFSYSGDVKTLAVIGPSGGGKSTLLRIIGGLIPPTSGEVILDGLRVDFTEKNLVAHRRRIGFVFQSKGLFAHLSAIDNITMPLYNVYGYNKKDALKTASALLERFGLEQDAHKRPSELSGGQQQRIAIARAIAARPSLLLLDEPTSALDPELTNEVLAMISELTREQLSIILVTHEMGFAKKACEKVMFLSGGKNIESGNSMELFARPRTHELKIFLGKVLEWKA
jgi:polar amino acid transport system ATP-binding protein